MKQRQFESQHQSQWQQLEKWLDTLDRNKATELQKIVDFPHIYRQVCQHLALAQDRHYSPQLIEHLNRLVLRGHQYLYQPRRTVWSQILIFVTQRFPQRVREEFRFILVSNILFFGSFFLMFGLVVIEPDLIYNMLPADQVASMESMYDAENDKLGRSNRDASSDFLMFGYYIRNNIGIGFQTFSTGLLFCLGTLFYLLFNGVYIGGITGHMVNAGLSETFFSFTSGHSSLELVAITFAGAAGLKLGMALIQSGRHKRVDALRYAAQESLDLVYGFFIMLVLAAFVEAFWSSNMSFPPWVKYSTGMTLWILLFLYFFRVGRYRAA